MKNDTVQPPAWVSPLEHPIAREIFNYELARRTDVGRALGWPRWDEVEPQVRLALSRALIVRPRLPVVFEAAEGYHKLTYQHPWSGGTQRDVFWDPTRPVDELAEYFRQLILNLRAELGVTEAPPPTRETRDIPWRWLAILDSVHPLNDSERPAKAKAIARGLTHVEAVTACFADPKKVIRDFDERDKTNG